MKRIRMLEGPTCGLAQYLAHAGARASWQGFRRDPKRRSELIDVLARLQHGLCGYCEIDLVEDDRQIEHVIPRSDRRQGAARALDPTNLIICCHGGELKGLSADESRYRPPRRENLSCGQAKDNVTDPDFIDPRTLPALPSLLQVGNDGRIKADPDACEETGFTADAVEKTIDVLGLNSERLRLAREKRWLALEEAWQPHQNDPEVMAAAAGAELLPVGEDSLRRFFTTNHSYFAPWSEDILAENTDAWI